jgi:hypothetical protein
MCVGTLATKGSLFTHRYERERAARGESLQQAWLKMLPASHRDKPCRWSQEELEELYDPLLVQEIEEQRESIDGIYEQLVASPANGGGGVEMQRLSLDDFRWAMDTVISRTFGGQLAAVAAPGVWQTMMLVLLSALRPSFPSLHSLGPSWCVCARACVRVCVCVCAWVRGCGSGCGGYWGEWLMGRVVDGASG